MNSPDYNRRRWFRYSLRTLLLLVTVASAGFGWLGMKIRAKQKEREAVAAIEKVGGVVWYDYYYDSDGNPLNPAAPPGPVLLQRLLGKDFFASVVLVDFFLSEPGDDDLRCLGHLPRVETVGLRSRKISDAGLAYLKDLPQLKNLHICDSQVTDTGLTHLHKMYQLEYLSLDGTQVTDVGCQELQQALPNLKILR
jgi:hypothetical protein